MSALVAQHQQTSFATPINGSAGDATVVLGNDNATVSTYNSHDADATIHVQSSTAAVFVATPAATAGRKWMTTDTGAVYLYYDTGSAWVEVNYLRNTGGTITGALVVTSNSASALAVGRQGATDPVLRVDASVVNVATGITITGAAAGAGVAITARSSGTNENLTIDAKGSGTITLGGVSTGGITMSRLTGFENGISINAGGAAISGGATIATGDFAVSAGTATITTTAGNQAKIAYDGSNHVIVNVSSAGAITLTATGAAAAFTFANSVSITGTSLSMGATPATTGAIRLTNATSIYARNAASNANYALIGLDANNVVQLGDNASGVMPAVPRIAVGNIPAGTANRDGSECIDSSNNRLVYFSGGNRYYLTGTSF